MRKFAMITTAAMLIATPVLAEGGWSSSQLSDPRGDRGDRGDRGGSAVNPGEFTFGLRKGKNKSVLFGTTGPFSGSRFTPSWRPQNQGDSAFGQAVSRSNAGTAGINGHMSDKARR